MYQHERRATATRISHYVIRTSGKNGNAPRQFTRHSYIHRPSRGHIPGHIGHHSGHCLHASMYSSRQKYSDLAAISVCHTYQIAATSATLPATLPATLRATRSHPSKGLVLEDRQICGDIPRNLFASRITARIARIANESLPDS